MARLGDRGADVRLLQEKLRELGFLDGAADGVFGQGTDAAVRAFQEAHGLDADGIVGPEMRNALDEEINTALRHAGRERDGTALDLEPPDDSLLPETGAPARSSGRDPGHEDRVGRILDAAIAEWELPVHEPPGPGWERIDSYIRGADGLGWSSETRYIRNRQFAWCGAFAAFAFSGAGLKKEIRKRALASTYRLYTWAKGTERMRDLSEVERGDIVLVGPAGGKRWGAHITICDEPAAGLVHTLEGNASGMGPHGDSHEGVIRQSRPLPGSGLPPSRYRVMHVIRPLPEDYD